MMNQVANSDSTYRSLYKIGGAAVLIAAVLILGDVVVLAISPAHRVNGFVYHENWLQTLLVSASRGGFRQTHRIQ